MKYLDTYKQIEVAINFINSILIQLIKNCHLEEQVNGYGVCGSRFD
ncbi:unnamed protein product [Paramecium octaurelia]|uniref:Uncharacterized protein n=1 Tax=Paramecium octaurelia TaxID=43137 RepID=A0A8S1VJ95_PAROT|nr:unnamed protein product [Paramecium octaurelia]